MKKDTNININNVHKSYLPTINSSGNTGAPRSGLGVTLTVKLAERLFAGESGCELKDGGLEDAAAVVCCRLQGGQRALFVMDSGNDNSLRFNAFTSITTSTSVCKAELFLPPRSPFAVTEPTADFHSLSLIKPMRHSRPSKPK
ncbi:hypothetical protein JOB18_029635 [Solea senegalensis]|uniref:Uncharacterized protein n=1 Tax=Solea senegalensis TaxID=28829 RepID=A0AAV6RPD8_SOLSE|nr:hypothetical protein JOB18_029635 [Solea senegalensis]